MTTFAVRWSPELHEVVRNFKKNQDSNIASLSNLEQKAVSATFSKNSVHKIDTVGPLSSWG